MPKRVDHDERRQQIATALLSVVSREGLDAASLRYVAAEAGVTSGMVQHYFPSKGEMVQYAMGVATGRYEQRITDRLAELGDDADPLDVVRVLVGGLIPGTPTEFEDARIALAFQAYAAHNADASERLSEGSRQLAGHLGELLAPHLAEGAEPELAALMLLATAEGLAVSTLSAGLSPDVARRGLDAQLALLTGAAPARSY
jgi:AcrR family transcriptional regulator